LTAGFRRSSRKARPRRAFFVGEARVAECGMRRDTCRAAATRCACADSRRCSATEGEKSSRSARESCDSCEAIRRDADLVRDDVIGRSDPTSTTRVATVANRMRTQRSSVRIDVARSGRREADAALGVCALSRKSVREGRVGSLRAERERWLVAMSSRPRARSDGDFAPRATPHRRRAQLHRSIC
jgi:hypothetical protein